MEPEWRSPCSYSGVEEDVRTLLAYGTLDADDGISESALLLNATSVGMAPDTEGSIIEDTSLYHPDLIVSDVIYNPRETRFLREAREAGCRTFNGMYMLLYQGAEAFRLWTGKEMPVEEIKAKYFSE